MRKKWNLYICVQLLKKLVPFYAWDNLNAVYTDFEKSKWMTTYFWRVVSLGGSSHSADLETGSGKTVGGTMAISEIIFCFWISTVALESEKELFIT